METFSKADKVENYEKEEKKFLFEVESPGRIYLTLDGNDPIYVSFYQKVRLEVCLPQKNVMASSQNNEESFSQDEAEDGNEVEEKFSTVGDFLADTETGPAQSHGGLPITANGFPGPTGGPFQSQDSLMTTNTYGTVGDGSFLTQNPSASTNDCSEPPNLQGGLMTMSASGVVCTEPKLPGATVSTSAVGFNGTEAGFGFASAEVNFQTTELMDTSADETAPVGSVAGSQVQTDSSSMDKFEPNPVSKSTPASTSSKRSHAVEKRTRLAKRTAKSKKIKPKKKAKSTMGLKSDEELETLKLQILKELQNRKASKDKTISDILQQEPQPNNSKTVTPRKNKTKKVKERKPDPRADPVHCDYCDVTFSSKREYLRHRNRNVEKTFECEHCSKAFPFRAYLLCHMKHHTEGPTASMRTLVCDLCGKKNRTATDLKAHMLNHTGEHAFQCCVCLKTMPHQKKLKTHLMKHKRSGLIKCSCCDQMFPSRGALMDHKMSVMEIKCGICGQEFPNRTSRLLHYKTDHPDTILRCHICKRMYSTHKELEEHTAKHFERKRKQCPVCGLMVTNIHNHVMTHKPLEEMNESELWMCDKCPGKFRTKAVLLAHMKTAHSTVRSKCHLCPMTFKTHQSLSRHLNSVHSSLMPYECEVCGKRCKVKSNLRIHMRTHSNVKHFPCTLCTQAFNYKSSLESHMRSKHSNEVAVPVKESVPTFSTEEESASSITNERQQNNTHNQPLVPPQSAMQPSMPNMSVVGVRERHTNSIAQQRHIPITVQEERHFSNIALEERLPSTSVSAERHVMPTSIPHWTHMEGAPLNAPLGLNLSTNVVGAERQTPTPNHVPPPPWGHVEGGPLNAPLGLNLSTNFLPNPHLASNIWSSHFNSGSAGYHN